MSYAVPTESERPTLFRWLKQQSSFSIWSKIDIYYRQWASEFQRAARIAVHPTTKTLCITNSQTESLLRCRAAFVAALDKIKRGDRSAFKWMGYGTGQGYFCEAWRVVGAWQTSRARTQEGLPLADTEYWPGFENRLDDLVAAWGNGTEAVQLRHTDVPAPVSDMRMLRGEIEPEGYPTFRRLRESGLSLEEPSAPQEEVLIPTGNEIPFYGIWEPVKLDLTPGFVGLFRKPLVPADGKFELDGCMNYLHAGSPAPTIGFEEDDLRGEGRPTTWRLLWRDERYLDGSIPEEEKDYIFVHPTRLKALKAVVNPAGGDLIVANSGTSAIIGGIWAAREHLGVRVLLAKGAPLPRHLGRDIEWVLVEGV